MSKIDYGALVSKMANSAGRFTRKAVDTGVSLVKPENLKAAGDALKGVADSAAEGWKKAGDEDSTEDPVESVGKAARRAADAVKAKAADVKKGFEEAATAEPEDPSDADDESKK
jgi:hypothetical protein